MKGLLIKDLKLLLGQRMYYTAILMIALALLNTSASPTFIAGYLAMLCMMFTISSCSYDEFDNGYAFLFCLPISRKSYVREKYVFGLLLDCGTAVCSLLILGGYYVLKRASWDLREGVVSVMLLQLVFLAILAVMLPIQLKYGSEKGKILQTMVWISIFAIAFLGMRIFPALSNSLAGIWKVLDEMNLAVLFAGLLVSVGIVCLVSLRISEHIMEKKEF